MLRKNSSDFVSIHISPTRPHRFTHFFQLMKKIEVQPVARMPNFVCQSCMTEQGIIMPGMIITD
jgi:hypothetical protein